MTTRPGAHNFAIYRGATFSEVLTWRDSSGSPVNLTGYAARMKARRRQSPNSASIDLATGAGIALGGTAGTITLSLDAAGTEALVPGTLDYDLELVSPGGNVTKLLQGVITVEGEITR